MSGGEFLRGVLDETMLFHELAIYTIELTIPAGPPALPLQATLALKADRSFLAMGYEMRGVSSVEVLNHLSFNMATIFNPKNSFVYFNIPLVPRFLGGNVNAPMEFPEYILFEPPGLIGFSIQNNATNGTALVPGDLVNLTLYGVEYARG